MKHTYKTPYLLGADFETDITDDGSERFVCQWAISPGNDFPEDGHPFAWTGKSIDTFKGQIQYLLNKERHLQVYFHNLPYDASYMLGFLKELTECGFRPYFAVNKHDPIILSFLYGSDPKRPDMSIVFRDSHKKLNNSLKEIGAMLGYDKLMAPDSEFTPGWSKNIDYEHTKYTDPDWVYVCMDAWICCRAMRMLHDGFYGHQFKKATFSGDAYAMCKSMVNHGRNKGDTKWNRCFPPLPIFETELIDSDELACDEILRQAYWGGINYSAHKGLNVPKDEMKIFHIDYHSMYPSQMKYRLLPYGKCERVLDISERFPEPDIENYDPETEVYIAQVCVTKMKLKEGRNPWYHLKLDRDRKIEGLKASEPVVELKYPHIITTCSVELEDLDRYYDMEFSSILPEEMKEYMDKVDLDPDWYPRAWVYSADYGLLGEYIDYWYSKKQDEERDGNKGGLRYNWSKVMMNSVYGRMAMSYIQYDTVIGWNENIDWYDWKEMDKKIPDNWESYIPYPIFVSAWARHQLLDAWLKVGCENVIHSDTDSIIFYGKRMPDDLRVTGNTKNGKSMLDTWGNECPVIKDGYEDINDSTIIALYEGGVKRYIEVVRPLEEFKPGDKLKNFVHTAMAGVPQKTFKTPEGTQYPIGMWIELLDAPERIYETDENGEPLVLGDHHYSIESEWLRNLYQSIGLCPDDVNTMKKSKRKMKGGANIVDTTFKLNSGFRTVIR